MIMMQRIKMMRTKFWIAGVLLAGFSGSTAVVAFASRQQALCAHPSHNNEVGGLWSGPCRSQVALAQGDAEDHSKTNPTHSGSYLSTRACSSRTAVHKEKKPAVKPEKPASVKPAKATKPVVEQTDPVKKKKKKKSATKDGQSAPATQ